MYKPNQNISNYTVDHYEEALGFLLPKNEARWGLEVLSAYLTPSLEYAFGFYFQECARNNQFITEACYTQTLPTYTPTVIHISFHISTLRLSQTYTKKELAEYLKTVGELCAKIKPLTKQG